MDLDFWRNVVSKVYVAGVAMVPFTKPGRGAMYDAMGAEAVRGALADADLGYADVQQAYVGFATAIRLRGKRQFIRSG
jgi:hypothetical protein